MQGPEIQCLQFAARCVAENEVFGGEHKVHKAFVILCGKELAYFVAASTVMEIDWQWDSLRKEISSGSSGGNDSLGT